jgi:CsoR family transcriptional regulator, copper-sensing transcriptional repressor
LARARQGGMSATAVQAAAVGLLEGHISHCVAEAVAEGGDHAAVKVAEASQAIARLVRS